MNNTHAEVIETIRVANQAALDSRNNGVIRLEHLLIGLMGHDCTARNVVENCYSRNHKGYINPLVLSGDARRIVGEKEGAGKFTRLPQSPDVKQAVILADQYTRKLQDDAVRADSLLYGLVVTADPKSPLGMALGDYELSAEKLEVIIPATRWEHGIPVFGCVASQFR